MYKLIATICLGAMAFSVATLATAQNSQPANPLVTLFGNVVDAPSTLRRNPRAYYRPARLAKQQSGSNWGFTQQKVRRIAATPRTRASRTASLTRKKGLDPKYARQTVAYQTQYKPGTIVIDTKAKFLYLVQENGEALRYGVGVARDGFEWSGTTTIKRKVEWPTWTPPAAMRKREPWLPARMEGGVDNPLGARAMYLYKGGRDTLYRIHGTNKPGTIGLKVSSGCIRLLNGEISDLFERVPLGTKVVVI